MRSIFAALVALSFAAACGDNIRPGLVVETRVSKTTLTAGERVDARCLVIDPATEDPAVDKDGVPLQDTVELVVNYQHSSSFSTDDEGAVIAAKAGTATVRCAAPSLGLLDRDPEEIEIVAGPRSASSPSSRRRQRSPARRSESRASRSTCSTTRSPGSHRPSR